MDKKVIYALIGGVALIGAAIAYSMSKEKGEGDQYEDALDQLG